MREKGQIGDSLSRSHSVQGVELVLLCVTVAACRLLASIPCHLYDDAFITMRYAENLAAGRGFVYNHGAPWEPILGTTTPAFTVVLAGARYLGADLATFVVAFNALCDAAIAWLVARSLLASSRVAAVVSVAAFAVLPELNRISAGGMESPLFVLSIIGAIHLDTNGQKPAAGLLATFAAAVRPEGILALLLLGYRNLRVRRALLRLAVPAGCAGLLYLGVVTAYFGSPIPHSVVAKASQHTGGDATRVLKILTESFAPSAPMMLALPLLAIGCWRTSAVAGTCRWFTLFGLALTGAYAAARPAVWGWYLYPSLTLSCVWFGAGIGFLLRRFLPKRVTIGEADGARRLTLAVVFACVFLVSGFVAYKGPSLVRQKVYDAIAAWARDANAAEVTVLAYDIGVIGYASGAQILDSAGLVWPEAAEHTDFAQLLRRHHPDYALITAVRSNVRVMQNDPYVRANYLPIRRFNTFGDTELTPQPGLLPAHWCQDYILYARSNVPAAGGDALHTAVGWETHP